ncbi:ABC transporter permease [Candidatus Curtissbacteria bacterium]|nr:ABC transporter permease [Candidatus Curtissbacteria bacterium]
MNLSRVFAIVLRHYFLTIHQLERFTDIFLFPILGLVLWGFLTNYVQFESTSLASFLLGGMILWVIFERVGTSVGIDFMWDVWERNLINVLASPITMLEYIVGLVLVAVVKVSISFVAMWLIAAVFFNFQLGFMGFSLAAFWINLVFFAVVLGIFNVSIVMRYGNTVGPLTWVLPFAIQPFAAVFYPVSVLPVYIQKVVWFLPITHVFEGMRMVFRTEVFDSKEFVTAFGLNVIYFVLVVGFFAYMFNSVKKKGMLVKL